MLNSKYQEISRLIQEDLSRINLLDDLFLEEPLKSKISEILNAPSKHIRPLVSFLYLRAIGKNIDENQILFQSAIELIHNASLIHDDIIDNAEIRRGKNTINKDFDSKLAVISGDYLLSIALKKVLKINNINLVKILTQTLEEMTKGEVKQYFDKSKIPTINDYLKKSKQKTAKLFEASLIGSLLIADELPDDKGFTQNFGIAFQIRDDLINCLTTKSDLKDGIYTAPIIYSNGININSDGIEKTKSLLNNYLNNALNAIQSIDNNKYKQGLEELLGILKYE